MTTSTGPSHDDHERERDRDHWFTHAIAVTADAAPRARARRTGVEAGVALDPVASVGQQVEADGVANPRERGVDGAVVALTGTAGDDAAGHDAGDSP